MEILKKTLDSVMQDLCAKQKAAPDADPQEWLKKTLTKKELGHIKVKYFSKGVLGLNVDSSAWLYSLSLQKEKLLDKLQKTHPELKNISLRIGDI